MAELLLLKRELIEDLDPDSPQFDDPTLNPTQWREYRFNTGDPDGEIFINIVNNATAFELTPGELVYLNPSNGDQYFYVSAGQVSKTAGPGPVIIPPLPDLTDLYGLRFLHEFTDFNANTVRFEIYKRAYVGASEEVAGAGQNLTVSWENEGKIFTSFRGSRADLTLHSAVSKKFYELFEGDERDHYGRIVVAGLPVWTGWVTPDIFNEPYRNGPFQTSITFNDGIGGLKNIDFPDVNDNGYTGQLTEKEVVIACLGRIGLRLNVNFACNLEEAGMDTASAPIEQSSVNVEAFVNLQQGERTAINSYEALIKILTSWNAVLFQQENEWWMVREPELYGSTLEFKKFDPDGLAISTGTLALAKTFESEGLLLHAATLETKPAFTNVAVSQEYGELLVENGNFAVNGNLENWNPYLLDGKQTGWLLRDWTYDRLNPWPYNRADGTTLGRVRRVIESTGGKEVNNYMNIYDVARSFSDPIGRLISKPIPIKKEIGNLIQVRFKVRCNTYGSDQRLVEAYFNIAVQCGTKWLERVTATGSWRWTSTETRILWKVAEVMRWEDIVIDSIGIPEDGDIKIYLNQMIQLSSYSSVRYVADFDDIEMNLVDNPALGADRIYYKTNNPDLYTSKLEELSISLGDVATVMSQSVKIIAGSPSTRWKRPADSTYLPLAQLICRELANQYQRTTYRLKSGNTNSLANRLSLLATYTDTVNEPGRKFIVTGMEWNVKSNRWNPDFVEINQEESTVEIRVVLDLKPGTAPNTGANSGGNDDQTGSNAPILTSAADANAVHYNAADGKDEIEKQQARDNIDVLSKDEVKEVTGELAQLNTPDKSNLVSAINQKGQYRSVGW
jgi:hypothetical protein